MKIKIIVEGKTELVLIRAIRIFLSTRLSKDQMPSVTSFRYNGRIPKGEDLKKKVEELCNNHDAVIALTDVYTGTNDFTDASDAKNKMSAWVGENPKFFPHAAQHDFEAWLLPFWDTIKQMAKTKRNAPGHHPESVNHGNPPAHRLVELFETPNAPRSYDKPRDAEAILRKNSYDLAKSANACPELKSLLNTILTLSGGTVLP